MNKLLVLFVLTFLFLVPKSNGQSQIKDTSYIYGRMIGDDTLVGYFYFTHKITKNSAEFVYKKNLGEDKGKTLNSRYYNYFEADGLYMENFQVFQSEENHLYSLIPLIINGSIQLFYAKINNRDLYAFKKDGYKAEFTKQSFKKQIAYLLEDDVDLLGRVKRGEFGYKDIERIISLYNESHPMASADE